jgi:hypothetical protein
VPLLCICTVHGCHVISRDSPTLPRTLTVRYAPMTWYIRNIYTLHLKFIHLSIWTQPLQLNAHPVADSPAPSAAAPARLPSTAPPTANDAIGKPGTNNDARSYPLPRTRKPLLLSSSAIQSKASTSHVPKNPAASGKSTFQATTLCSTIRSSRFQLS